MALWAMSVHVIPGQMHTCHQVALISRRRAWQCLHVYNHWGACMRVLLVDISARTVFIQVIVTVGILKIARRYTLKVWSLMNAATPLWWSDGFNVILFSVPPLLQLNVPQAYMHTRFDSKYNIVSVYAISLYHWCGYGYLNCGQWDALAISVACSTNQRFLNINILYIASTAVCWYWTSSGKSHVFISSNCGIVVWCSGRQSQLDTTMCMLDFLYGSLARALLRCGWGCCWQCGHTGAV